MRFSLAVLPSLRHLTWGLLGLLLGLGALRPQAAQATHIRAGDIQSRVDPDPLGNNNRIYFTLTLYLNINPQVPQDNVDIYFGDGTKQLAIKLTSRSLVPGAQNTNVSTYEFDHIFPGSGQYTVSFVGENRVAGILNMSNSVTQNFYINTVISIDPANGKNRSPVLRAPALDRAGLGQVFVHNPAGFDADGDSLAYYLRSTQQVDVNRNGTGGLVNNNPSPTPSDGYVSPVSPIITGGVVPRQVLYSGVPAGVPGDAAIIVQDARNGQITWNAPARVGFYNIAFVVEEWRRGPFGIRRIGQLIRDMQIEVVPTNNLPPLLVVPLDLCVIAGQAVTLNVSARDGSGPPPDGAPTPVTLFAFSGLLPPTTVTPPATFVQNNTGTSVTGTFRWQTQCANVADQPYVVVFKAQDTPPVPPGSPPGTTGPPALVDIRPVSITVVGPPPQNVRAVPTSSGAGLVGLVSWDSYACQNASQLLIYRSEGPVNFNPSTCQTGIPNGIGYVRIGAVPATAVTFADDNGGRGLTRGKTYCYRIYATYPLPAGGASLASNESCLTFSGRSAQLTNVDVNTTDPSTGQITVKWTQPRPDLAGSAFGAPFGYALDRGLGASPTTFVSVDTIRNLSDTTYVDRGLNTTVNQYTYRLKFFNTTGSGKTAIRRYETAPLASSVRTSLVPSGLARTITVNFGFQVPWDNTRQPARVFRRGPGGGGAFSQVGTTVPTATGGSYVDRDPALVFEQDYCYYVQTNGQYPTTNSLGQLLYANLLNNSQQVCTQLLPTPCTPVLSIRAINCDSLATSVKFDPTKQLYQNFLRWTAGSAPAGCVVNAAYYRILRAKTSAGPFVAIDSTSTAAQLTYLDRNLPQQAYCYAVQAVAPNKQRSALSNIACQTECVFFVLPNIFTPNGDSKNDLFRPKTSSEIARTRIQIFNRWGRKVYESDRDPYINWDGGGKAGESATSGLVSNGLYYYLAEVEFKDAAQTKRTYKGWVEVAR